MKRGMVVALHLEDAGIAVADIDHAGILAGALDHARALGRQFLQMGAGGFVGAMLAPHHREDAELDQIGVAAEQFLDAGIFLVRKPMLADQFGRHLGHDSASIRLSNRARPSVPPKADRTTRSGWGIRPSTLRFSLRMPAMSRAEPLGLSPGVAEDHAAFAFQPVRASRRRRSNCLRHAPPERPRAGRYSYLRVKTFWVSSTVKRHRPADEFEAGVAHQGARQQCRFRSAPGNRCRCRAPRRPFPPCAFTSRMTADWLAMAPQRR